MKIHILFRISPPPAGGGNQFLRILRDQLRLNGVLAERIEDSAVVLFNSHQWVDRVAVLKNRYPDKVFIHRVDGPMRIYNSWSDKRDYLVKAISNKAADGTIFQSYWSRVENHRLGMERNYFEKVIYNSVDPDIFNKRPKAEYLNSGKVKLITTCWSTNPAKGFEVYEWLDSNLDWSRYEMTLVGSSPLSFKNIRHVPPMTTEKLAEILKDHDIYMFASRYEACSNALLEAMHCGLPVIASKSSSNPEIVGKGGELFSGKEEIPGLLEKITRAYTHYRERIDVPPIDDIARRYIDFAREIHQQVKTGAYVPKRISRPGLLLLLVTLLSWRINGSLNNRFRLKSRTA